MSVLGGGILGGGSGGGGAGGAVDSVNGATGVVILDANDVGAIDNQDTLTGLTGGTATDLDSLTTSGVDVGWIVAANLGVGLVHYQLQAGTDAEASPDIIRPDDYATTTNEKVWVRVS